MKTIGFVEELTVDPRKNESTDDHVYILYLCITNVIKPLSTNTTSKWNEFFKDKELMDEVDKDVKRTLPHLHFFNSDKSIGDTSHYEALKRILFVFAKLNPGIRYVQGFL